jgi:hypothetical protein
MSRMVTLFDDENEAVGNAILKSDDPGEPPVLLWRGRTFVYGGVSFDEPAPGDYESYLQKETYTLPPSAVSPPEVVPTVQPK